ncbi:MAG: hypothetical protein IT544_06340 [Rhodobacteraceae bacterium]|nr:hypothetical protein [Paracoccaceae bacterium]
MTIEKTNRIVLMISTALIAIATTHAGAEEAVTEKEVFTQFIDPVIFNTSYVFLDDYSYSIFSWDDLNIGNAILNELSDEHGGRVVVDEISTEYEGLCNSWRMLIEKGDADLLTSRIQKELKEFNSSMRKKIVSARSDAINNTLYLNEEEKNKWNENPEVREAERKIEANIVKYLRGIKTDRVYNNMQMGTQVCETIQEVKDSIRKRDHYYAEKDKLDKAFAPDNPQEGN